MYIDKLIGGLFIATCNSHPILIPGRSACKACPPCSHPFVPTLARDVYTPPLHFMCSSKVPKTILESLTPSYVPSSKTSPKLWAANLEEYVAGTGALGPY